jgi:hypothetical protein
MASILKVDTIQDQSGNNIINENADTITIGASGDTITVPSGATFDASSATVTIPAVNLTTGVTGTLPVANGGTNLISGFANGITEADQWRITANHTGVGDVTTNWERVDNAVFNYIGTGMSESSGIFTFPSTGIYFIKFNSMIRITLGDTTYLASRINTTPDNSTYSQVSSNYGSLVSGAYGNAECNYMFDVTNTSTHKVKFNLAQNQNGTPLFLGSTDENQTYATFIRLGDT